MVRILKNRRFKSQRLGDSFVFPFFWKEKRKKIAYNTTTYRSQQRQLDILQKSSAGVAARRAGRPKQAVEGHAGEAADPGEGEGQDRGHYLVRWS